MLDGPFPWDRAGLCDKFSYTLYAVGEKSRENVGKTEITDRTCEHRDGQKADTRGNRMPAEIRIKTE